MAKSNLFKASIIYLLLGLTSCLYAADNKNTSGTVKHLNRDEFKKLVVDVDKDGWKYLGDKPCIIDFYATWCGPCRMISPYLDDLAKEYKDEIYIYKVDVDKEKELAGYFGATSIPLLIFVPKDAQPQASRGALPKEEIRNAIKTVLLKK